MLKSTKIIKNEHKKIIGIEPLVDQEGFITLLLADLASKSKIHYLLNENINTACLSADYKRIIESIMYEDNGYGTEFATIIDISEYYESQIEWEEKLGIAFKNSLNKLNKQLRYDLEFDEIEVDFTNTEINEIKSMHDEDTLKVMDHFSSLISAYPYSRRCNLHNKRSYRYKCRVLSKDND